MAQTAPYMHNGFFERLDQVVEFTIGECRRHRLTASRSASVPYSVRAFRDSRDCRFPPVVSAEKHRRFLLRLCLESELKWTCSGWEVSADVHVWISCAAKEKRKQPNRRLRCLGSNRFWHSKQGKKSVVK